MSHTRWQALDLPVQDSLPALARALERHASAVLSAPPGAGKTTVVPLALLDARWLEGRRIVMLEPRRLATRAAARRMAQLLGEDIGQTVGYRVRLDSRISRATRIEVVTEGVLTRLLLEDPTLEEYGLVIFDEFHERSLQGDIGLALTLHSRRLVRPDLRILVMSATIAGSAIAAHLDDAPVIDSEGRQFPVEVRYSPTRVIGPIEPAVARAVQRALAENDGDVLAFLPGAAEIRRAVSLLEGEHVPANIRVVPLFGMLTPEEQDLAIAPSLPGTRKVVLATSIAETSLTIEGVRAVVDSGLARVPRFSPRTGMTRLHTTRVSHAAAEQRRGRAGRLAAGVCYRLWPREDNAQLLAFSPPEILEADLVPMALDLAIAGVADAAELTWIDAPPAGAFAQARELLTQLAALDAEGRVTTHGRRMSEIGVHPRLAHMIVRATGERLGALACDLAALLGDRDPLRGKSDVRQSDIRRRLALLRDPGQGRDAAPLRQIRAQAAHWRAVAGARAQDYDLEAAGRVVALAYPDRVAQRRLGAAPRYLLRNGLGARLDETDSLSREPFLVIAETDGRPPENLVYLAAMLTSEELETVFVDQIQTRDVVRWNDERGVVEAHRERRLGAILLSRQVLRDPPAEEVALAVGAAVRRLGLTILPWSEGATGLRQRLAFLHRHNAAWPDVSDGALSASLLDSLTPELGTVRSAADLRRIDVRRALLSLLSWEQRSSLDRLAPTHIDVPTGSRLPIDYSNADAPAVAVRLQELFGCANTPSIMDGAVPLTLELLSPAHRPVQVTRDLAGFWRTSYFDVRRDLRGRYPKHEWPEDPLSAKPTARAKPRR